jgi:PAS domain S-box-containing protein
MEDRNKTKVQLIEELVNSRQRVIELEAAETERMQAEEALRQYRDHLEELVKKRTAELTKANVQLRNSKERLTLAIAGTGGALWDEELDPEASFDDQSGKTYYSPEERQLLGYEEGNALAPHYESWYDHVLPEDRALVEQRQRDHFEGRTDYLDHEYRAQLKDGSIRWIRGRSRIIRDQQGRPMRWIGIDWDVTERKQAEEELQQHRKHLEELVKERTAALQEKVEEQDLLLDTMDAQVWYLTDIETYGIANRAHAEFLGLRREDIEYKKLREFLPEEVAQICKESNRQVFQTREAVHTEEWVPNAEGEERLIAIIKTPKLKPDGNVAYVVCVGTDITERKRTEKALQESKKFLQDIFDGIQDGISVLDKNLTIIQVNKWMEKRHHKHIPLVGKKCYEVYQHRKTRCPWCPSIKALSTGTVHTTDIQVPYDDGASWWCELSAYPLRDEKDNIVGVIEHVKNITERKQSEQALRESERRYRRLFNGIADAVFVHDLNGGILDVNREACTKYGYSKGELIQMNAVDIDTPKEAVHVEKRIQKILDDGGDTFETAHFDREGNRIPVEVTAKLARYRGQDVIISICHDITERKRAEQERERLTAQIREQARQMEQILATVPAGVLLLDAEGRVLHANPMGEKDLTMLTDAKIGDVLMRLGDQPLAELLTSPPTRGLWHEIKATSTAVGRTFEAIARSVETGPEPGHWVLVINDVTREREIQAQLQQQQRLAAVGQLAAGIAHDFNNIMASIVLYAEMVARSQQLSERDRERMAVIIQQVWQASRLVEQVLDFSRRTVLERRPLDLLPLLKEQVKMLEQMLPEHIEIELVSRSNETDYANPYVIEADPTRMQQMVTNLAVNARDAMPDGGTLRIELVRMTIQSSQLLPLPNMKAGEWLRLTISDTGTGIAPDVLPHIFEPFFTTKGPGGGSGLGLAQVHGIVGLHGGHIDVETQMGAGTTFSIYLPALKMYPAEPTSLDTSATVHQGRGEVVLVVEGGDAIRTALVDSLEQWNYQTLEAVNGQEALAVMEAQGERIALVLSDVVMPGTDGIALFHALRERGWQTPVILLTDHPLDKELATLQAQGLSAWFLKPPSLGQLAQAVAEALRP